MTAELIRFIRGAEEPIEVRRFDDVQECLEAAQDWKEHLSSVDQQRQIAYVVDNQDTILWTFPPELQETTFDADISSHGNSYVIVVSKQVQLMGLRKGDIVNVTIRRKEPSN